MSQRHIFHILYCKAIVYPGIRDTDLTGEACQHDPKVIVIPYPSYMKIHIVHASVDGACAGAATSSIGTQCRDAEQQHHKATEMSFGTQTVVCVKGQRKDATR